jgi:hypothetical protein
MSYNYEDIYGVSLHAYMNELGLSLEDLFSKTITDIKFLKENLYRVTYKKENAQLQKVIFDTINKKQKHLDRMIEWAKIYCAEEYEGLRKDENWRGLL